MFITDKDLSAEHMRQLDECRLKCRKCPKVVGCELLKQLNCVRLSKN